MASLKIVGMEKVTSALGRAAQNMQKPLRRALTKVGKMFAAEVQARLTPGHGVETGLLKASIGHSIREKGTMVQVGARRGFRSVVMSGQTGVFAKRLTKKGQVIKLFDKKTGTRLKEEKLKSTELKSTTLKPRTRQTRIDKLSRKDRKAKVRNPVRYAHLVEKGVGGKHPARAYPFIAPAQEAGKQQAIDIVTQEINQAVASGELI